MEKGRLEIYPENELLARLDGWILKNTVPGERVPSRAEAARRILKERFDRDDRNAAKREGRA